MKLVIASKNPGKLKELLEMASNEPWLEFSLAPEDFNPKETGKTFYENAAIKAQVAAAMTGLPALGDDSGLVVEALNGRPGIFSSRYVEGCDQKRCAKLLEEMKTVPEGRRDAAFICTLVLCAAEGKVIHSVIRAWTGYIGFCERGENGFGFDPVFYLKDRNCTAAELSKTEKNKLSHRGQAFREMLSFLSSQYAKGVE